MSLPLYRSKDPLLRKNAPSSRFCSSPNEFGRNSEKDEDEDEDEDPFSSSSSSSAMPPQDRIPPKTARAEQLESCVNSHSRIIKKILFKIPSHQSVAVAASFFLLLLFLLLTQCYHV